MTAATPALADELDLGFPEPSSPVEADPADPADPSDGDSIAEVLGEADTDLLQIQAQIDAGEYEIPKAWLTHEVEQIEASSHRYNPALVRPVTMLGDIMVLEGDYVGALDNYGRAIHLERVSSGLVSPRQVEIVYREAEVYRTLGDYKRANEREEYAYFVLRQAHEPYDEELLPGLFHLAKWYEATHNVYAARSLYHRAADVLTANGKGDTLEAIPAWQGIARSYRLERFPPFYMDTSTSDAGFTSSAMSPSSYGAVSVNSFPAGERALQNIIQIHRKHGDDPVTVAKSILDLADWHLLFDKTREAFPLYEIAWEMLSAVDGFPIDSYFAEPTILHFPAPSDPSEPGDSVPTGTAEGQVKLMFDITDRGTVRRLRTTASEPEGMMDFRVRKSIRIARFRPMLVDGKPVPTSDYEYTYNFTYYPQVTAVDAAEVSP